MAVLYSPPALADLEALGLKVPTFPFSLRQLIRLAREEHFPEEVINFYKSFPVDEVFEDADDLMARTEQVEIMMHEEADQPFEYWSSSEED